MRTLLLTGLLLASVATGFLMGTAHSASYAATKVQYEIFSLGAVTGCPMIQLVVSGTVGANGAPGAVPAGQCRLVQSALTILGAQGWRLVALGNGNAIFMK